MSPARETLLEQALALSPDERAKLASGLLASLDDEPVDQRTVETLWSQETDRRMARFESGENRSVTLGEVRDGLDALRGEDPA